MDALSDVLRVVRLRGAVFFNARLSAPWCVESPPAERIGDMLGVRGGCVALFHLVVSGRCRIRPAGLQPVDVAEGSIVVFPQGHSHVMGSALARRPRPLEEDLPGVLAAAEDGGIPDVAYGGGGDRTRFVCGYLHCDQRFNPLIGSLPTLIVASPRRGEIRALDPGEPAGRQPSTDPASNGWLESAMARIGDEVDAEGPGSPAILTRLTELLYLEVVRWYMRSMPEEQTGWLAGVRHPQVGHALRLMHARPEHDWTVEELGRAVGLSRSALSRCFREVLGQPPMRYLARWRMQVAQDLLTRSGTSIARVANRVGYASEPAFNRAFKRHLGLPPAAWREEQERLRSGERDVAGR